MSRPWNVRELPRVLRVEEATGVPRHRAVAGRRPGADGRAARLRGVFSALAARFHCSAGAARRRLSGSRYSCCRRDAEALRGRSEGGGTLPPSTQSVTLLTVEAQVTMYDISVFVAAFCGTTDHGLY